jgi:1-deoxyxylulose-5-phosphate synthase
VRVSRLALGTSLLGVAPGHGDSIRLVQFAIDSGINLIDTANSYGSLPRFDRPGVPSADQRASAEELVGAAIAGRRDEVILATKVSEAIGPGVNDGGKAGGGLSRAHIMRMVERSLRRLRTDCIDIYYAHFPDPVTEIADTLSTFDDLITQGKIRYYALSRFSGWRLTEAIMTADRLGLRRPICHQTLYNLGKRQVEVEVIPAGNRFDISLMAFSPLGGGLFAGAARTHKISGRRRWGGPGFREDEIALGNAAERLAAEWNMAPPLVALAWLLVRPTVASAIVGPESTGELTALLPATELCLTSEQVEQLDALLVQRADL